MKLINLLKILPFVLVFLAALYKPYDADLGWHLKYGQYFFEHHQILRDNIYSTEMPDFKWANTSWVTDLLTFLAYHSLGFLGLTLLSSAIVTLTFFFFSRGAKLTLWQQTLIIPLILYMEEPVNQVSFRGQQLSLLFLGGLFYILSLFGEKNPKKIFWLIPLFWLWINLNGEFLLGLGLFSIWAFLYLAKGFFLESKTVKEILNLAKYFGLTFLGSILASLINPFGIQLYEVAISHAGSPLLKDIIEYLPFDKYSQLWWNHLMIAAFFLLAITYFWLDRSWKEKIPYIGMSVALFILAINVRRFAWPTYYLAIPLLQPLALMFEPKNKRIYYSAITLILVCSLLWVIKLKMPLNQFQNMNWQEYCQKYVGCSAPAAEFMLKNGVPLNMLTHYNWGGWLIWNYPEIKPSMDGRMHLWKDPKTGYSAFANYYDFEQNLADINDSKYDAVFISPDKPLYDRLNQLVTSGTWRVYYQDSYSTIFIRN